MGVISAVFRGESIFQLTLLYIFYESHVNDVIILGSKYQSIEEYLSSSEASIQYRFRQDSMIQYYIWVDN
ncbi:unnamed protein product [Paramecium octaurelia]|uniref:Uncharacterized protein n=1 Tax=Paramecium octaurelia TaxID=43137 RepID=A0A8S1WSP5_PAROT|nr:unnamed protein product [Paramecium octaurelia]